MIRTDQTAVIAPQATVFRSIGKGVIVWQFFQLIDLFSANPLSIGIWIFESLAMAIIFSILLGKPLDLAIGVIIAAYAAYIGLFPGLLPLLYLIWSFHRMAGLDSLEETAIAMRVTVYAGIWRRAMAFFIDCLVFLLLCVPFSVAVGGLAPSFRPLNPYYLLIYVGLGLVFCLLLSAMECSSGASLGKKAMGLRVVDLQGNNLKFGTAFARNFVKVLVWTIPRYFFPMPIIAIVLLGGQLASFYMAAVTRRHQALYDVLANSLVVRYSRASDAKNSIIY